MYDAVSLVEPRPGRSPLLATVADHRPAGDFVAVHNFPPACTQLPHVSADMAPTVLQHFKSSQLINALYT